MTPLLKYLRRTNTLNNSPPCLKIAIRTKARIRLAIFNDAKFLFRLSNSLSSNGVTNVYEPVNDIISNILESTSWKLVKRESMRWFKVYSFDRPALACHTTAVNSIS